ncbi:amidase [Bacillus massiliglaciei]|uniref:amidase n=1 Tax=Bacillus massiliglaciei TaxID=1816693 RepID=UPI000A49582F|nr:amidase family protein [Bacillus massiliglaciei]
MIQENNEAAVKSVWNEDGLDITELSVKELQNAMEQGLVTSEELTVKYLERIKKYDKEGPAINSLVYVNERAILTARELDREREEQGIRGWLHGIPIVLKDNYDTFDMLTTASSLVLKNSYPLQDSFMVQQLKEAGAVIIGKSNMHEFAYGISTHSSLGGQTLNPYKLERHPGGSSGGTAAAVAANFAAVGLGTDTGCSIRNPAAHNNLVGLRPTQGLTSRSGIIPISFTQDTGGPIGRNVEDVALVMDILAGKFDERDPSTKAGEDRQPESYLAYLQSNQLKKVKIGILIDRFGGNKDSEPVNKVLLKAISDMESNGAEMLEIRLQELLDFDALSIPKFEFKTAIEEYLNSLGESRPVSTLEEIIESGLCSPTIMGDLTEASLMSLEDPIYKKRLDEREQYRETIIKKMNDLELDAILYPTFQSPAPYLSEQKWEDNNGDLSAYSGLPAVSVPAGFTEEGIPVGLELLARPFEEGTLLGIAYSFEQKTKHRKLPVHTPR